MGGGDRGIDRRAPARSITTRSRAQWAVVTGDGSKGARAIDHDAISRAVALGHPLARDAGAR
ncbi:Hypothetical protein A7982_06403 [Minicystis rosea]|nr:Hypothetical protein A7982_06403 [Minicystis rosea]